MQDKGHRNHLDVTLLKLPTSTEIMYLYLKLFKL